MQLAGTNVLVTGASRGVGKAVSLALAAAGAGVVLAARTAEPGGKVRGSLAETADEIRQAGGSCHPVTADLSVRSDLDRLVADACGWRGPITVLVNNAAFLGRAAYHTLDELSPEAWDRQLALNLTAPLLLAKALVPHMHRQGSGAIVNLTSAAAELQEGGRPGLAYGATKAALSRLTMALSRELRPQGIAAFAVDPGYVRTEIAEQMAGASGLNIEDAHSPDVPAAAIVALLEKPVEAVTGKVFQARAGLPPLLQHDGTQDHN